MNIKVQRDDFDTEPVRGLPEELPDGEVILWQGSPTWRGLARRAFHTHKVAVYFAALLAWRVAAALGDGASLGAALGSSVNLLLVSLTALGLLALLARLNANATIYTLTDRRIVIRCGVALTMAVNIPFARIGSAAVRAYRDGSGDIPLEITGEDRCAWLMLWPHARPWRFGAKTEPMLRALPDVRAVAALLSEALEAEALEASVERAEAAPAAVETDRAHAAPTPAVVRAVA